MSPFLKSYIETALWSSHDDNGKSLDDDYTRYNFDPESLEFMQLDCERFQADNALEGISDEQAGHDFWLTRNGHGAGFWDRGLGDIGDRLTEACKKFGESNIYVGDNGKLHVDGHHESPETEAAWRLAQQAQQVQKEATKEVYGL